MQRRNRESNSLRKNEVGAPKGAANLATSFLIRQAATRFARRRIVFYIPSAHSLSSGRARGMIRFQGAADRFLLLPSFLKPRLR